jgi:hypothetical protein
MRRIDPVLLRPPAGPPFVYQQERRTGKTAEGAIALL